MKKLSKYISLAAAFLLAVQPLASSAEVIYQNTAQETILRGVTYQTYDTFTDSGWVRSDIIRMNLEDSAAELRVIMSPSGSSSLSTVKTMASSSGAKAAINGDFFNYPASTGAETNMLGMVFSNGELVSTPSTDGLVSFVLTEDNTAIFDYFTFSGTLIADHTSLCDYYSAIPLYQVNKVAVTNGSVSMYTSAWGDTVTVPEYCYAFIGEYADENAYRMTGYSWGGESVAIPDGGAVFIANYSVNGFLNANFAMGDVIKVEMTLSPDVSAIKEAVGGNTLIVKDGEVADFVNVIAGRSQRTAIGVADDGKTLLLVTIDGRESDCPGMTQTELANFMISLGCTDAINLDGGGSTTMITENRMSGALEVKNDVSSLRSVSTAVGIFAATDPLDTPYGASVEVTAQNIVLGDSVTVSAVFYDENYVTIPDCQYAVTSSDPDAVISGTTVTFANAGTQTITVMSGDASETVEINVLDDIFSINLYPESIDTTSSDCYLTLTAYDRSGQCATVPASMIEFSTTDSVIMEGNAVKNGSGSGTVTAHFQGFASTGVVNGEYYDRALDERAGDSFEGSIDNALSFSVTGAIAPKTLLGLYTANKTLTDLSNRGTVYTLSDLSDEYGILPLYNPVTGFSERTLASTKIITLANSDSSSISSTDSSQWLQFKNSVENAAEKNIVILMNSPSYNMITREKEVFDYFLTYLSDNGKNVFVLSPGAKTETTVQDGIRYIYLGSVGSETIASYGYDTSVNTSVRFTVSGEDLNYSFFSYKN
ncbi:MAG: phosphodiester glycosidase family protein [Clostridia bacterium]|nr:phosphodiester glycosidase family protein [Clostridia bacterium]